MTPQRDIILLIDDDPDARSLLREGVFDPDAYQIVEAADGADGLLKFQQAPPDLILLDLHLGDLSGRDMLVALKSQGFRGPIVVLADGGSEKSIIEAFRLGATDYITRPLRETEVLSTVERGLADTRLRRQHGTLAARISHAEGQLEEREAELERLYHLGKETAAVRDQAALLGQVLQTAAALGHADYALLMLRDDATGRLILQTGYNMQISMADRVGEPVQDSLAELVMTSREALTMAGDSLRRFQIPKDVCAVVYLPLVVQTTGVGVLAVGSRASETAFDEHRVQVLKIVADYAAIGIVNARLFNMVKQRARSLDTVTRDWQTRFAAQQSKLQAVNSSLVVVEAELSRLAFGKEGHVPPRVGERLLDLGKQVKQLLGVMGQLAHPPQ